MTPPRLVQAAVAATCVHTGEMESCFCEKRVRKTLAAAFAALPEMERHVEVEGAHWETKVRCSCGHEEPSRAQMWKHEADSLRSWLAALAREFGEPT